MQTDEYLMMAVADGDLKQLGELYRRYRQPVYGFLLQRVRVPATAEDLLQETFERIIKYRTSFQAGKTFRSWLYTIARNVWHDRLRKDGRLPINNGVDVNALCLISPSSHSDWEARETGQQSLAALAALPESYREVIDLAWKRGLKYAEIAAVLGISEANVKVRMHRATKKLRENYAKLNTP